MYQAVATSDRRPAVGGRIRHRGRQREERAGQRGELGRLARRRPACRGRRLPVVHPARVGDDREGAPLPGGTQRAEGSAVAGHFHEQVGRAAGHAASRQCCRQLPSTLRSAAGRVSPMRPAEIILCAMVGTFHDWGVAARGPSSDRESPQLMRGVPTGQSSTRAQDSIASTTDCSGTRRGPSPVLEPLDGLSWASFTLVGEPGPA